MQVRILLSTLSILAVCASAALAGQIVPVATPTAAAAPPGAPEVDAGMLALLGTAASAGIIAFKNKFKKSH
jgi:hypothetical protein